MQEMDAVFRALGDPARRRLLDRLNDRSGLTLSELAAGMGMTRQAVSKHLAVLEEAGLVATARRGREKLHFVNAAPINDIADRWIHHYDRARAEALADLKTALEATPMKSDQRNSDHRTGGANDAATGRATGESAFVYTTYIQATPERVWQGLTDPTFTERYWRHPVSGGVTYRTDWQKGSPYDVAYDQVGLVISDPEQLVLESDPYRRLAYTWHTFTPEWAAAHGFEEATAATWRAESRSKVAFDIEEAGEGVVKLTVVHDGFVRGSAVLEGVRGGWPAVIASLKTLLETGSALPGG
jgi:DNA-binding transcriptional ArsR family regulator/uncharacterized protein YndB with AHSA1/START domain